MSSETEDVGTPMTALRAVGPLVGIVVGIALLWPTFAYLRDSEANRATMVVVALVTGVAGVFFLFWTVNRLVDWLPERFGEGLRPYVFIGPALVILSVFLVYPVINTVIISFRDARSEGFVGLDNYEFVFTDDSMLRSLRNTAGWIVLVPLVAVLRMARSMLSSVKTNL